MCMMADGLLRWGSLTCCHVIGGTSNNIGHGWHLCSQWCLFNFLHYMGQGIIWSMYVHSIFFQFVHWVISCDEEWWSCLMSFHAMEQSHGISDQHMRVELWEFRFWGRLVCLEMWLCCFDMMIILVYNMVGWVICLQIYHLIIFRVLIKGYQASQSRK